MRINKIMGNIMKIFVKFLFLFFVWNAECSYRVTFADGSTEKTFEFTRTDARKDGQHTMTVTILNNGYAENLQKVSCRFVQQNMPTGGKVTLDVGNSKHEFDRDCDKRVSVNLVNCSTNATIRKQFVAGTPAGNKTSYQFNIKKLQYTKFNVEEKKIDFKKLKYENGSVKSNATPKLNITYKGGDAKIVLTSLNDFHLKSEDDNKKIKYKITRNSGMLRDFTTWQCTQVLECSQEAKTITFDLSVDEQHNVIPPPGKYTDILTISIVSDGCKFQK